MCFAIPLEVLSIKHNQVSVIYINIEYQVLAVEPMPNPGDYVLVHGGIIIKVLTKDEAMSILQLINQNSAGIRDS